jgi:DNA-binding response OmpR family regulator
MDVRVPAAAPSPGLAPALPLAPPPDAAPLRVLVADDEQDVRDLVCIAVRKAGATAVTAVADGTAALHAARLDPPDIAVLDVAMPGASGLEVCAALRADPRTETVRVLLVSAGASLEDVARGLAAGADAYLAKPFAVAGLVHQVHALAGRPA